MTRGTPESSLHASEVRKMLRCRHFSDGKQILRDADAGGVTLPFVEFCLALRADYRTRNPQTMVQVKQGLTGECPRWLNTFFQNTVYDLEVLSRSLIAVREAYNRVFTVKKQGGKKGSVSCWNGTESSAVIGKTG